MNIHILMVGTVTNAAAVSILIYASQCHVKTFLWWNAIGVKLLGHRLWISSSLLSATTLFFPSPWSNFAFAAALDESLLFCILSYFAVFSFLKLLPICWLYFYCNSLMTNEARTFPNLYWPFCSWKLITVSHTCTRIYACIWIVQIQMIKTSSLRFYSTINFRVNCNFSGVWGFFAFVVYFISTDIML